jgi:hypothetical protein
MIDAPFLTVPEVRQEVERISRRKHRSSVVALFGRGETAEFDLEGRRWRVVPTRCELDLRERLPRPDEKRPEGSVFLIDWAADVLPLDVACRLAGGRLYHVARDARLAALFGARFVETGLAGSALAKLFLSGHVPEPRKIQGLELTRAAAWGSLLDARIRLPETVLTSLGALLAWAGSNEGGPAFCRQAESNDLWRNVRRELHEWLRESLGEAAVVVWQAWERGLAARLTEVLPLLTAAREAADPYLAGQVAGQMSAWLPDLAAAVRAVEADLTQASVIEAALPSEPGRRVSALERSQALADGSGLHALTVASMRLPGGHRERERELAEATEAFLSHPGREKAAPVVAALTRIEDHALDSHLRPDDHRSARRNLGRLALWLAERDSSVPTGTRWQPAVDLARSYAEDGGFVEWARQQLRGLRGADEALLKAAREIEAAAADALREDHHRFAEAYVCWLEAGKPSASAVPIEDTGRQVIAPFLKGDKRRKLLVVLMDGMSHAAAVQVLTRAATARRWGPVAWRRDGWQGALPLPPVLAVAPTLTEISRAAFFAGRVDTYFADEGSEKDPVRWKSNPAVAEVVGENAPPLFVRRDILSGHDLTNDVRDAVRGDARVVAVVVNAIDEDLKGSVQVAKDYSQAPVLPLDALLTAAEEGERVVLLVADHGHILGDGARVLEGRLGRNRPGGPRWRALAEDESPEAEEVVLPKTTWVPDGWDRVAVLWDPTSVNRSPKYGEHGGLSLAEAVAPALLIAPEWLERAVPDDPSLAVRPFPSPSWWDLRTRISVARPVPPAPAPVQESMFGPAAPEPTVAAAPSEPALVGALRKSAVFQGQTSGHPAAEIERVLSWVAILAETGGAMPAADFAAASGVRIHQVAGVVARMGILNADGFAMVEHDHVGRRVVLQRTRLAQHYGIKE